METGVTSFFPLRVKQGSPWPSPQGKTSPSLSAGLALPELAPVGLTVLRTLCSLQLSPQ